MQKEETDWSEARVIFGKLIGINKKASQLTIEYKDGESWEEETFSLEDWTDEDYDGLLEKIGEDITLTVVDHSATNWEG